jgi:hypothetical protein
VQVQRAHLNCAVSALLDQHSAAQSFAVQNAPRQRGASQSGTARSRSSHRPCTLPARRQAVPPTSVSRTVMRRVTPAVTRELHRAACSAPDQVPRAPTVHPDDTLRARVPCAARSATALHRAHRPRAAPHRSFRARAAQRAACLSRAPRLPTRRPACGNESGSFATCQRARSALPRSPPPSGPCKAPRRAFSARTRVVGRARHPSPVSHGTGSRAHRPQSAATRDAGFLRPPLGTAPLAPARRVAARETAPARRGAATKAGCHVSASAGRRTPCRTAPPLARGFCGCGERGQAQRAQRLARARRRRALLPTCNVARKLRFRVCTKAWCAACVARSRSSAVNVQRAARWACSGRAAAAPAAYALPVAAVVRSARLSVLQRAPPRGQCTRIK